MAFKCEDGKKNRSPGGYTKIKHKKVDDTRLFQLEGNEKHLELENVVMG